MGQLNNYNEYELSDVCNVWNFNNIDIRTLESAIWIVENKTSLRRTCREFMISKSQLHRDMNTRLKKLSYELYLCVRKQLKVNRSK